LTRRASADPSKFSEIPHRSYVGILDGLTEIIWQLRHYEEDGVPLDLRRIEHIAIDICVDLELATGDETILLRFGHAMKSVKAAQVESV
jgi:hypothetical protein